MDDLSTAVRFFKSNDRFVLTTHEGPDADGLGAEVVLIKALRAIGKTARSANADPLPPRYAFIDPEGLIERYSDEAPGDYLQNANIVVVDSSDPHNLGLIFDSVLPQAGALYAIDHHESVSSQAIQGYIDTSASSTCEMAVRIADQLGAPLDAIAARAAYAGIVFDTGSFIYPKTSATTFKTALRLVESGAVPNEVYRLMHESSPLGALLLQKLVLSTLELHENGRVALQTMMKSHLEDAGASFEDAEPLINIPLRSKDVEVSILFKESIEGRLRCSMRSKGSVNVSAIAQGFGGGGHRTAAGFKCVEGLAQTKREVLKRVASALAGC